MDCIPNPDTTHWPQLLPMLRIQDRRLLPMQTFLYASTSLPACPLSHHAWTMMFWSKQINQLWRF